MGVGVPKCRCHGVPAFWIKDKRYRAGGFVRCRIRFQEHARDRYHNGSYGDRQRKRMYDRYHDPANGEAVLRKLMYHQLRYHRQRLKEMTDGEVSPEI